jgi:DNA-binding XRE family transcriptional regulator
MGVPKALPCKRLADSEKVITLRLTDSKRGAYDVAIMKSGPDRLREWIERSKCNQTEAAKLLGFTKVFLSQILNGVRTPGLANAINIQRVTGISVESWAVTDVSSADDCESDKRRHSA